MTEFLREPATPSHRRNIPARCPLGGRAPCMDDLCHGVDQTICGLELYFDFCEHGHLPETCAEHPCNQEEDLDDD